MKTAIYPGSFDPVTLGHLDIIKRSAGMFDKLIVLVLKNSAKKSLFTAEERVSMMEGLVKDMPNVCVDTNDGLLVDYAKEKNATIVIRVFARQLILNMSCSLLIRTIWSIKNWKPFSLLLAWNILILVLL